MAACREMIKAVLFDLDGTLLDRDQSLAAFLEHQYYRIEAFQCVDKFEFMQRFIDLDQKGYVWKDQVYQRLIEDLKLDLSWKDLLSDYIESFQSHCIGFPGVDEVLGYLKSKGVKLGVITNGYSEFQMNNIKGLRITHYFDEILISEREGIKKPEVEIFQRALKRLGVEPSEALFVGDHPINDVEASINAGMQGIWKRCDYFERPTKEHILIDELRELKGIFEGAR